MLARAYVIQEDLIEWRRDFHAHPELGFRDSLTSALVGEGMEKLGYRVRRNVGKTGVVAEKGGERGPCISIRADVDALPILEANEVPYRSQNEGTMHACGHDSHTAMALGAAALLAKASFAGKVRFSFQPSEEAAVNEGLSGAQRMIEAGAMQGVGSIIALHIDPASPVGNIHISPGPSSGGVDSWYGRILGGRGR